MKQFLRLHLINFLVSKLFKLVSEEDFFTMKNGRLIHRGVVLTEDEKKGIIAEAQYLKSSKLLQVLFTEMAYLANRKMYFESNTTNDLLGGKYTLWTLDVLGKKIENLSNLK